ncbi:MAG: hypothetical protein GTO23_10670 [Nitrososphaeria archaeon]|nr:hypothetical protein [Nitrososphaeria archaeon]
MCEDISLRDIPATYFDARCFHLGPLIGEVESDIVREASRRGILTSLDVQGYCRSLDMEGLVNIGRWDGVEVLRYVKVLKSDLEEALCVSKTEEAKEAINFFWGFGVEVVLVTMGEDGSLIGCEEMIRHIPAFKPNEIVDPTGAGDAYSAAFLVEYLRSKDPVRAALFASSAASFVLEGEGVSSIPSEEDVWDRCSVQEPTGLL